MPIQKITKILNIQFTSVSLSQISILTLSWLLDSVDEAVSDIKDGSKGLVGRFGIPENLSAGLLNVKVSNLTRVNNYADGLERRYSSRRSRSRG